MKVLVVGSGGREHALVKKLSESNYVSEIHAIPGNDSMKQYANTYPEISDVDIEKIKGKCESLKITWAIIGPEAPLNIGLTDSLEEIGVKVFGPRKLEAQLESSKEFAKKIMQQYDIPTADYRVFYSKVEARKYIEEKGAPIVLKKDGLAAGKGVAVAMTIEDALKALDDMLDESTEEGLVIEEFLEGEEFSLMVLVNGSYILPFDIIAQDHKRAYDHDQGPNTGGMGAYAPVTHLGDKVIEEAIEKIVQPMADAMVEEGLNYFGVMYLGAIITKDGIKVIEFNARFGDPEAQILLSLLESDLIEVLEAVNDKKDYQLQFSADSMLGIILASKGYPETATKGLGVKIPTILNDQVFNSGLKQVDGENFETAGGRTLLVTARGENLEVARHAAYENLKQVEFHDGDLFYRTDIGAKGL